LTKATYISAEKLLVVLCKWTTGGSGLWFEIPSNSLKKAHHNDNIVSFPNSMTYRIPQNSTFIIFSHSFHKKNTSENCRNQWVYHGLPPFLHMFTIPGPDFSMGQINPSQPCSGAAPPERPTVGSGFSQGCWWLVFSLKDSGMEAPK
jgi:hypothetical protein